MAFDTLERELGCKWQDVYSELGPDPVAAASLGQVYKGVLKATATSSRSRCRGPRCWRRCRWTCTSCGAWASRSSGAADQHGRRGLLDEWAERFFEELDYVKEGETHTKFAASIKDDLPQVVVPSTYAEYTQPQGDHVRVARRREALAVHRGRRRATW